MFTPPKCRSLNRDKLWDALIQHVENLSKRHAGKIKSWEVLHAAIEYNEIYNFVGIDSIPEVFRVARKVLRNQPAHQRPQFPRRNFGYSDDLIELLEWLKTEGSSWMG